MLEVTSILIMSVILLGLTTLMVVLFIKHLNVLYEFIEEILKFQTILYQEILAIKISLNYSLGQKNIEESKVSDDIIKETNEKKNRYPLLDNRKKNTVTQEKPKDSVNRSINSLESSEISDEELSKLIKGKELMFKKQVDVDSSDEFVNTDINI